MAFSRIRVRGLVLIVLAALLPAGPAAAAPFWVAWEGNDYPENEGWERVGTITAPTRTLSNGIMNLDSLTSDMSEDLYAIYGTPNPEPGEEFVVQWRLRVNQVNWDNPNFRYDPGWLVNSADGWQVHFVIGVDELHNLLQQRDTDFDEGVFHAWEFRSADMRSFTIDVDGARVAAGEFRRTLPGARLLWGDFVQGPTSSVDWDYFRFGVIPEPALTAWAVLALMMRTSRKLQ